MTANWTLKTHLQQSHELVVQVLDMTQKGYVWYQFDTRHGLKEKLSSYVRRTLGCSVLVSAADDLIYVNEQGLIRLNCKTRSANLIFNLDLDENDILRLWMAPDNERLYYVLSKRPMAYSKVVEIVQHKGFLIDDVRHGTPAVVYCLQLNNAVAQKCLDMNAATWRFAVDVARSLIFAVTNRRELLRYDLAAGNCSPISTLPMSSQILIEGISATNDKASLLIWTLTEKNQADRGIFLFDINGQMISRISEFGYEPVISQDGKQTAFLSNDGVWLTSGNCVEQIYTIESYSNTASFTHAGRRIVWCECGRHLAVSVPINKGKGPDSTDWCWHLLVGDMRRKEIAVYDVNPCDYHWKPCEPNGHGGGNLHD